MSKISLPPNESSKKRFLRLTGIEALYTNPVHNESLKITYYKDVLDDDYTVNISIECVQFDAFVIRIHSKSKTIKIELIIESMSDAGISFYPGSAFACIVMQVRNAARYNYKYIDLEAARVDNKEYEWNNKLYSLFGYKVFGKYGFKMYRPSHRNFFRNLMDENFTTHNFRFINEIYTGSQIATEGKKVWDRLGRDWSGRFFIDEVGDCKVILDELIQKRALSDN